MGCDSWSATVREEHKVGLFEGRVLNGTFGSKREQVTGDWRELHSEELHDLCCSPKY